jgi:hypothetical protein
MCAARKEHIQNLVEKLKEKLLRLTLHGNIKINGTYNVEVDQVRLFQWPFKAHFYNFN